MKLKLPLKFAALATAAFSAIAPLNPTQAQTFGQTEVTQNDFVAVASPAGTSHKLLIIEQIPGQRQCWSESGSNPTIINPLLTTFDFSGHCRRNTDSNGYSIRVNGEDLGLDYQLMVVRREGELQLVGAHRRDFSQPYIVIGRSGGLTNDFAKFYLEPGWRFTKRTYNGSTLGHVYLTNDGLTGGNPGGGNSGGGNSDLAFSDIANDIYKDEIAEAVDIGFIAGFKEDNTFRPLNALTREQVVSMALEAVKTIPNANVNVPTSTSSRPYPDVETSRWSAAKIQWAKQNNIVSGYPDGNFRPAQAVTRAELMAIMKRAAEYGKTQRGLSSKLNAKQTAKNFSDTANHWGSTLVTEMSAYCGVASPLNETGNAFYPDRSSQRNYAAAATLRMLNCVKSDN
ncbi:MAG: DUF3747 domain-containing protein [Oscillatoria sp. PMC 1068.18]|nr:DUF3747 domain-containing protein [Oscillatoria sp. PMC 1076.18]MEC4989225.1 DUF3747 domain-containing protein [Oscillatoria sp. PMC 1068.18]